MQPQLLPQPSLPGSEAALGAALRLWRVGRNHLDAQLPQRPANLRQPMLVHRFACLRSQPEVAAAIAVQGVVRRGRKREVHRKRRPRRPVAWMLLHIDGSTHQWFEDERWHDLLVILDDATSRIYYAQLAARGASS
jgi:hypothetical protein